jgi:hypothetical protein
LILGLPTYERFSEFANGLRRESGERKLTDEECFNRFFDELEAFRRAAHLAQVAEPSSASQSHGSGRSRHIPDGIRRRAMIRARFACEICRNRFGLDLHHVVPFCEGGSHELDNLVVLCWACHQEIHGEDRRDADACAHGSRGEGKPGAETVSGEPPAPMPSRDDGEPARADGDAAGSEAMDTPSRNGSPPQSGMDQPAHSRESDPRAARRTSEALLPRVADASRAERTAVMRDPAAP